METLLYIFLSIGAVSLVSLAGLFAFSLQAALLHRLLFVLVGLAAGSLIGDAVIHLIPEALDGIGDERIFGMLVLAGIIAFFILEKYLRWHHAHHGIEEEHETEEREHHPRHLAPLVLIADGLHNTVDGAIIAASYFISPAIGIATTIAVFLHEIPQEIADYALLIHSGLSRKKALLFNFFSALTAVFGAVMVILLQEYIGLLEAFVAAFTAGAFIYIGATDLIPELQKTKSPKRSVVELAAFVAGVGLMLLLTFFE
ncbi:hypothetical protein A2841_03230 [Candidatus Kaiserbacteria bacterium RIFCSPHIGHO2_01_FULL_48_10]|uniref:ZIP family metal transporter n=1 Tax=Candidatus Kaiserbacteria bacterium RIFCSPHIGHO2_01_FULL_48_10 TaxID=1798476 RepID=A0A1F6C238_9BACT|nr:MAG: hypothetical protein A2841_03230 [Candidatus Kaiserbacteria bacterium RIFCSPHIGHO2_01_FULL_48_10]